MNGQAKRPDEEIEDQPAVQDSKTVGEGDETEPRAEESASEETPCEEPSEIDQLRSKADENWDRYLRTAAELENVRKRAARDIENAHKYGMERFARELLAVKDSLEMGLAAAENASVESLLEGSTATLKLLTTTLQQFKVDEVDPAGEPFDPDFHEAISMQPSDDVEPGSVLSVVQKGYTLNGRLLRPAMVIVASE